MTSDLPPFAPNGIEDMAAIPARFRLEGYLRLDREGRWWYRGEPIAHPGLVRWLWQQLRRTADGSYWVVNGPQRARVELAATPFFVRHLRAVGTELELELGGELTDRVPAARLYLDPGQRPWAEVRVGAAGAPPDAGHPALLLRTAVADLASLLVETETGFGLRLGTEVVPLKERALPPISRSEQESPPPGVRRP